jgi:hypothetical protein
MRLARTLLLTAGLLVVHGPVARGQVPSGTAETPAKVAELLRTELRRFAAAQEDFFSAQRRYARSVAELRGRFRPTDGIVIVVLVAGEHLHSEIAISAERREVTCAFFVGDTPPPLGEGRPGYVECRTQ